MNPIKKYIQYIGLCALALCFQSLSVASPYSDSLLNELNTVLKQADTYDQKKLAEIAELKRQARGIAKTDLSAQYNSFLNLYDAYKYYNYDSAFLYTQSLRYYANRINDPSLIADAKIKQVFILLSGGLFKETFDSLNVLNVQDASVNVRADFYALKARCYYDLADFDADGFHTASYYAKASDCMDSALSLYPQHTFEYLYYAGLQNLKKGNTEQAVSQLERLLNYKNLSYHEVALATSTIGGIFSMQGDSSKARDYFIQAAIADIKSSTKETSALLSVASIIFREGKIEDAAEYIEKANADATFYKARLRKVQVGALLPLIKEQLITTIQLQKQKLVIYLVLLGVLVLLLAGVALIVRKQVIKLKAARLSLQESYAKQQQANQELEKANALKEKYNDQLKLINSQLTEANLAKERYNEQVKEINRQLLEANKIKEEYLGYYFSIDTAFMARMEKLLNTIERKLVDRRWEEIKLLLRSVDFKTEKEELLVNFDKIFLKLFPDFVEQFNTLFAPEDRFILKKGQLLNTELRIFALIRMGITDNEKIAQILNYSINTIYAYKTKMRNKAIVAKEDFDKKITQLTTISDPDELDENNKSSI